MTLLTESSRELGSAFEPSVLAEMVRGAMERCVGLLEPVNRDAEESARQVARVRAALGSRAVVLVAQDTLAKNLIVLAHSDLVAAGLAPVAGVRASDLPWAARVLADFSRMKLELGGNEPLFASADPAVLAREVKAAEQLLALDHWLPTSSFVDHVATAPETLLWADVARAFGAVPVADSARVSSRTGALVQQALRVAQDYTQLTVDLEKQVTRHADVLRDRAVAQQLSTMDLDTIRSVASPAQSPLRLSALKAAGLSSVQSVITAGRGLMNVRGIAPGSAQVVLGLAQSLRSAVRGEVGLRLMGRTGDKVTTDLLNCLRALLAVEDQADAHGTELSQLWATLNSFDEALRPDTDHHLLHASSRRRAQDLAVHLEERANWFASTGLGVAAQGGDSTDVWADFAARHSTYMGLLARVLGVDAAHASGGLPEEIAEGVRSVTLDLTALTPELRASLRIYQSFGASFAVHQRRVLLGDEMGLGKTIQALATMAHLHARGARHFVVVCPTAVVGNWIKETRRFSSLNAFRLHGADKAQALQQWKRRGGVAVTSFDTFKRLAFDTDVALLVVDEAHTVKNPQAQRSQAVQALAEVSERVLFMSGTPLENKVEDFTNLVAMLQPNLVSRLRPEEMVISAKKFRAAMAPVYLRRNANDVLTELPDLTIKEEWVELTATEARAADKTYSTRAFHQLRQIAWTADPSRSSKMARLKEIVEEAALNGRKVLVFSYYREVLGAIAEHLPGHVSGVITGDTSLDRRSRMTDEFTDHVGSTVLLGQITAMGTGLNLQAATEVVLCEPQVKPSIEFQAMKRAHRMGQAHPVQVHRMLSSDAVDEDMLEILEIKTELFNAFAHNSAIAEAAPEATAVQERKMIEAVWQQAARRMAGRPADPQEQVETVPESPADRASITAPRPAPTRPPAQQSKSADRNPSREPVAKPQKGLAPRQAASSRPPVPQTAARVCGSCDGPISVMGHCNCS